MWQLLKLVQHCKQVVGWEALAGFDEPAYEQPTLEFMSSCKKWVQNAVKGQPLPLHMVSFYMMEAVREMTLVGFNTLLGLRFMFSQRHTNMSSMGPQLLGWIGHSR